MFPPSGYYGQRGGEPSEPEFHGPSQAEAYAFVTAVLGDDPVAVKLIWENPEPRWQILLAMRVAAIAISQAGLVAIENEVSVEEWLQTCARRLQEKEFGDGES